MIKNKELQSEIEVDPLTAYFDRLIGVLPELSIDEQIKQGLKFDASGTFEFQIEELRRVNPGVNFKIDENNVKLLESFRLFTNDDEYKAIMLENICQFYQRFNIKYFVFDIDKSVIATVDNAVEVKINDNIFLKIELILQIASAMYLYYIDVIDRNYLTLYLGNFNFPAYTLTLDFSDKSKVKLYISRKDVKGITWNAR